MEINQYSILHMLVDRFFRIGCHMTEFQVDYDLDKSLNDKTVSQYVCYIGPIMNDNRDIWENPGGKPCSQCLCQNGKASASWNRLIVKFNPEYSCSKFKIFKNSQIFSN